MSDEKYCLFQYCYEQKKVVPVDKVIRGRYTEYKTRAMDGFTTDDMPPTRSPVNGEYFTSKSKLREQYVANGFREIGDAYDRGYNPEKAKEESFNRVIKKVNEQIRERLNNGPIRHK